MDQLALRNQLNSLEMLRSSLHSQFRFWEWMVVVGLVIDLAVIIKEFRDDWKEFEHGIVRPPEAPSGSLLVLGLVGTGLIAFGISRELMIDSKIEGVETQIRAVNEQLFGIVSQEAENADRKANVVNGKADAIQERLDAASARMGALEGDILAQGPRAPLIENSAPELVKRLSAFHGQNVDFLIWRENSAVYDRDALDTWGAIANAVGEQGARWNIGHGGFTFLDTHLSAQGVMVFVNSRAPTETMEAAKALSDGLKKTLPPSENKMLVPINPDFVLPLIARGLLNKASPDALVAQDSTLIAVLIGENQHKRAKTTKK